MSIDIDSAIRILSQTTFAKDAIQSEVDDWFPDRPPNTLIFSSVGRSLSKIIDVSSSNEVSKLFIDIEFLLNEGDDHVVNGVATGLLEAIASESSLERIDICKVAPFFGERTKKYLLAWDKWTGVVSRF